MRTALQIVSTELSSGSISFSDEEIDTVDIMPKREPVIRRTAANDIKRYFTGGIHFEIEVAFRIARYETLLNLWELFNLTDSFALYPHLPEDAITNYSVIWMNPDEAFVERWRRGLPMANYVINATFREPLGAICVPPTS